MTPTGRRAGLVDTAVTKRFDDFARTVDYFIARVRPDDPGSRNRTRSRTVSSSSRTLDGCGKVDAWLPPLASLSSTTSSVASPSTSTARTSPKPATGSASTPARRARSGRAPTPGRRPGLMANVPPPTATPRSRVPVRDQRPLRRELMLQILERLIDALRRQRRRDSTSTASPSAPRTSARTTTATSSPSTPSSSAILTGRSAAASTPSAVPLRFAAGEASSPTIRPRRFRAPVGAVAPLRRPHRLRLQSQRTISNAATARARSSRQRRSPVTWPQPLAHRTTSRPTPHPTPPSTGPTQDSRPTWAPSTSQAPDGLRTGPPRAAAYRWCR